MNQEMLRLELGVIFGLQVQVNMFSLRKKSKYVVIGANANV